MRTALALLVAGLSLAGCTTTPMTVSCDPFRIPFTGAVPRSATFTEIQTDLLPPKQSATAKDASDLAKAEAYEDLIGLTLSGDLALAQSGDEAVLALSGGGQWGAFGAGYLEELNKQNAMPRFGMITGVSTGALQALFVGASQAPGADSAEIMGQLVNEYTIKKESDIVNRGTYFGALFNGSVAKLDPLRLKIEKALCSGTPTDTLALGDCPLIKALGTPGAPVVMLGFVEARTGEMQAVNVSAIAQAAMHNKMSVKTAQQCITGGALASVAMPFFYQQVQVTSASPAAPGKADTVTYYDGGVRQSMFLWESVKALAKVRAKRANPGLASISDADALANASPVYMIRNGPTVAKVDDQANRKRGAIPSAERAYSLLVNQSEVSAIEAIRLRNDKPEMRLATADGFDRAFKDPTSGEEKPKGCEKTSADAMFEPNFMECLQAFGRFKASDYKGRPQGWIILKPQ